MSTTTAQPRRASTRCCRAAAADVDLAPPYAPGEPRQLARRRLDELDARPSRATPLTELEEAMLIAVTGCTGLTMPDRPVHRPARRQADHGQAQPEHGRPHGGQPRQRPGHALLPDQRQRHLLPAQAAARRGRRLGARFDEATLLARAARGQGASCSTAASTCPTATATSRPTSTPTGSSRTCPGTTILFPVVDLSRQYINGIMYLLTQPEGARPTIVDDRNFYRMAGVKKWVRNGFLNKDIKLPLGAISGDAHADRGRPAAAEPDADRGRDGPRRLDPRLDRAAGPARRPEVPQAVRPHAGLRLDRPAVEARPTSCAGTCRCPRYANMRANAVGLRHKGEHLIKAMCPPNYDDHGRRRRRGDRRQVRPATASTPTRRCSSASTTASSARATSTEASNYAADVIACTRDICTYIYETHGRFPAHCRRDPRPGRVAAGPPRRERVLRGVLPRRPDRRARGARRAVARGRVVGDDCMNADGH